MVKLRFLSFDNNAIRYTYQPESDGKEGILAYNKLSKERIVEELAENDNPNSGFYRSHAFRFLEGLGDDLPNEKIIMWY